MMNNIWDKMKGFATPYAADDDYDDLDDEMEDGFAEEESTPRYSRRSAFDTASTEFDAPEQKTEPLGDSFSAPAAAPAASSYNSGSFSASSFSGHVMNGTSGNKQQMVLVQPKAFTEMSEIAQNLMARKAVVLNLEDVKDKVMARRYVDFMSGCTFALSGSIKKIAKATYMFCPNNMEILGDLPSMADESDNVI